MQLPQEADGSATQMGIAWVLVLGLAIGLTLRQARRIAAGHYDFRVDRSHGWLALPPGFEWDTCSCSNARTGQLLLANIMDIRVATREQTDSEGDKTTYFEPMIIHRGCVAVETVVRTQTTEEHAKEIVKQLRQEIGLTA